MQSLKSSGSKTKKKIGKGAVSSSPPKNQRKGTGEVPKKKAKMQKRRTSTSDEFSEKKRKKKSFSLSKKRSVASSGKGSRMRRAARGGMPQLNRKSTEKSQKPADIRRVKFKKRLAMSNVKGEDKIELTLGGTRSSEDTDSEPRMSDPRNEENGSDDESVGSDGGDNASPNRRSLMKDLGSFTYEKRTSIKSGGHSQRAPHVHVTVLGSSRMEPSLNRMMSEMISSAAKNSDGEDDQRVNDPEGRSNRSSSSRSRSSSSSSSWIRNKGDPSYETLEKEDSTETNRINLFDNDNYNAFVKINKATSIVIPGKFSRFDKFRSMGFSSGGTSSESSSSPFTILRSSQSKKLSKGRGSRRRLGSQMKVNFTTGNSGGKFGGGLKRSKTTIAGKSSGKVRSRHKSRNKETSGSNKRREKFGGPKRARSMFVSTMKSSFLKNSLSDHEDSGGSAEQRAKSKRGSSMRTADPADIHRTKRSLLESPSDKMKKKKNSLRKFSKLLETDRSTQGKSAGGVSARKRTSLVHKKSIDKSEGKGKLEVDRKRDEGSSTPRSVDRRGKGMSTARSVDKRNKGLNSARSADRKSKGMVSARTTEKSRGASIRRKKSVVHYADTMPDQEEGAGTSRKLKKRQATVGMEDPISKETGEGMKRGLTNKFDDKIEELLRDPLKVKADLVLEKYLKLKRKKAGKRRGRLGEEMQLLDLSKDSKEIKGDTLRVFTKMNSSVSYNDIIFFFDNYSTRNKKNSNIMESLKKTFKKEYFELDGFVAILRMLDLVMKQIKKDIGTYTVTRYFNDNLFDNMRKHYREQEEKRIQDLQEEFKKKTISARRDKGARRIPKEINLMELLDKNNLAASSIAAELIYRQNLQDLYRDRYIVGNPLLFLKEWYDPEKLAQFKRKMDEISRRKKVLVSGSVASEDREPVSCLCHCFGIMRNMMCSKHMREKEAGKKKASTEIRGVYSYRPVSKIYKLQEAPKNRTFKMKDVCHLMALT